jgi:lysozyme
MTSDKKAFLEQFQEGVSLIKKFEGCRLTSYWCPAGVLTIGYGTTRNVSVGQKITQKQAEEFLIKDCMEIYEGLKAHSYCSDLNDHELGALLSFIYNLGMNNFLNSTLKKYLAQGRKAWAADEFVKWNKARGQVLPGLTKRRLAERELFLTPVV